MHRTKQFYLPLVNTINTIFAHVYPERFNTATEDLPEVKNRYVKTTSVMFRKQSRAHARPEVVGKESIRVGSKPLFIHVDLFGSDERRRGDTRT